MEIETPIGTVVIKSLKEAADFVKDMTTANEDAIIR